MHVFQPNSSFECVWLVLVWPLAANVKTAGGCWSQRKSWFERVRCDDVQSGRCHQQMILYFDDVSWCLQVIDRSGCGHWPLVRSIQVRSGHALVRSMESKVSRVVLEQYIIFNMWRLASLMTWRWCKWHSGKIYNYSSPLRNVIKPWPSSTLLWEDQNNVCNYIHLLFQVHVLFLC